MFSFARKLKDKLEGHPASALDHDSYFGPYLQTNNNGFGLRVLHVDPTSPAKGLHLEAWFDYIVGVNGHSLPMKHSALAKAHYSINDDGLLNTGDGPLAAELSAVDYSLLAQEFRSIAAGAHPHVCLDVWSAKGGVSRKVYLELKPYEAGAEEEPQCINLYKDTFQRFGLTVQAQHLTSATFVWRILNTHPSSPAFQAQLIPYSDYIIGCDSCFPTDVPGVGLLASGGEKLLPTVLLNYYNYRSSSLQTDKVPIKLYVYNHDYDVTRPVTVHLSRAWAVGQNKGILGCDVGYGLLHRLPEVIGKYNSSYEPIGDVVFDAEQTPVQPQVANPYQPSAAQKNPQAPSAYQPNVAQKDPSSYQPKLAEKAPQAPSPYQPKVAQTEPLNSSLSPPKSEPLPQPEPKLTAELMAIKPYIVPESPSSKQNLPTQDAPAQAMSPEKKPLAPSDTPFEHEPVENPDEFFTKLGNQTHESLLNLLSAEGTNADEGEEPAPSAEDLPSQTVAAESPVVADVAEASSSQNSDAPESQSVVPESQEPQIEAQETVAEVPPTEQHIASPPKPTFPPPSHTDVPPNGASYMHKSPSETSGASHQSAFNEKSPFNDHYVGMTNVADLQMSEIPLDDNTLPYAPQTQPPVMASRGSPFRAPIQPPAPFSPGKEVSQLLSMTAPPVRGARKKKSHAAANVGSLTDFMNAELSKSKESDVKYVTNEAPVDVAPPPRMH